MKELEFDLPEYIKQEIDEYICACKESKGQSGKLLNIRTLLRVAMINEKLTYEQVMLVEKSLMDKGKI